MSEQPPIPERGQPSAGATRAEKVWFALVMVAVVLVGAAAFVSTRPAAEDAGPGTTPNVEATAVGPGPAQPGSQPSPALTPAAASETPSPEFGKTPVEADTPYEAGEDEEEHDHAGSPDGFESTTDREPQDGDGTAASEVIRTVIPTWATNDTSQGNTLEAWGPTFSTLDGASAAFYGYSRTGFVDLWSGLSRMDVSAENARIVSEDLLWNVGSHSLWRVSVERDLVSNSGRSADRTERVTWDFLVSQDDEFELVGFLDSAPENEAAETFYLPGSE